MAEEKKSVQAENEAAETEKKAPATEKKPAKAEKKAKNTAPKKPNIFVRMFRSIAKFFKDLPGEMRKVTWTPKNELKKSTLLVIVTVVAVSVSISVVDTLFAFIINSIAGLIG